LAGVVLGLEPLELSPQGVGDQAGDSQPERRAAEGNHGVAGLLHQLRWHLHIEARLQTLGFVGLHGLLGLAGIAGFAGSIKERRSATWWRLKFTKNVIEDLGARWTDRH
jgi:hypothetical protein